MEKILFVVPAKGNSQGIPSKNLQLIGPESLLARTLKLAKEGTFTLNAKILISTESNAIVEEVYRLFALKKTSKFEIQTIGSINEVAEQIMIHKRPLSLSEPLAKTSELIDHLLNCTEISEYKHFLVLQPTSPFRSLSELLKIIDTYFTVQPASLATIKKFESPHPEKRITLNDNNLLGLNNHQIDILLSPRQILGEFWALDGAYYLFSRESFQSNKRMLHKDTFLYSREGLKTINIDTREDLAFARFIAEERMENIE